MTVDWIPWASQGFCHTSEVTSRTGMGWGRRVGRSHGQLPDEVPVGVATRNVVSRRAPGPRAAPNSPPLRKPH